MQGAAFSDERIEADGFAVRYRQAGSGRPLVVFHGAGGLRISRAHEILAERFRVVAFEAPGFGLSAENLRSASIQDLADSMAAAARALGIERFSLMGSSFGGKLALWLAVRHPDLVETLVLVAPAAILPEGRPRPAGPPEQVASLLYAHPERQPALVPPAPGVIEKQEALLRRVATPNRDPALEEALPRLDVPVLVLFGTRDRVIPPEMGRDYRRRLPNCHLIYVYDAGHAIDADRPEAFASVVGDFLERREAFVVPDRSALLYP